MHAPRAVMHSIGGGRFAGLRDKRERLRPRRLSCARMEGNGARPPSPYGASAPFVKESWSGKKGLAPPGGRA